jgi:hypothetical protein
MGRIIYSPATRARFQEDALLALDALSRECGEVEICPPHPSGTPFWEVAVSAAGRKRLRWSVLGVTLAEAAGRMAAWKGVEVRPNKVDSAGGEVIRLFR